MEARNRYHRAAVWLGSVAAALLLFGGTALATCTTTCYSCGSWCTQQGVERGMWYQDPNTGRWRWVGGTGWENCYAGSQCWADVGAACTQKCDACLAAGGCYGGSGGDTAPRSCETDASCRIVTGTTQDGSQVTSVCWDFCWCATVSGTGYNCRDTRISGYNGPMSTQYSQCKCPN